MFLHMLLFVCFFSPVLSVVLWLMNLFSYYVGCRLSSIIMIQLSSEGCIYLMIHLMILRLFYQMGYISIWLFYQMGYISTCGYERGAHDTPDCHCVPSSI